VKYENPRDAGKIPDGFKVTDVWEYFWRRASNPSSPALSAGVLQHEPARAV
jgi:hypothetical protein